MIRILALHLILFFFSIGLPVMSCGYSVTASVKIQLMDYSGS